MEKNKEEGKQKELDREESQDKQIQETGQVVLDGNSRKHKVELLTVIGEIEEQNRLGQDFDLKKFHSQVLEIGGVQYPVLEKYIDAEF